MPWCWERENLLIASKRHRKRDFTKRIREKKRERKESRKKERRTSRPKATRGQRYPCPAISGSVGRAADPAYGQNFPLFPTGHRPLSGPLPKRKEKKKERKKKRKKEKKKKRKKEKKKKRKKE